MLSANGIYDVSKVNQNSKAFTDYTTDQTSLQDFLSYLISCEAIDVTSIEKENHYYDSDEMYTILINYIIEHLQDDKDFNNRVFGFKYIFIDEFQDTDDAQIAAFIAMQRKLNFNFLDQMNDLMKDVKNFNGK